MLVGEKYLRLKRAALPAALGKTLECLGLCGLFMIFNVATIVAVTIVVRTLTPGFVSAYAAGDVTTVVFAICQAIAFQWWRADGGVRSAER